MSVDPGLRSPEGGEGTASAQLGLKLLVRLNALLRTARTHDVTNQAFRRQLKEFLEVITQLVEEDQEDEVTLVAVADYFYLNGVRIKAQPSMLSVYHSVMSEFERRELGGLRFLPDVHEAELERFFQLFVAADETSIADRLVEMVREANIHGVIPVPAVELDADDLTRDLEDRKESTERGRAKRVFWRAVLGTRKIVLRAHQTGRPDLRQAKRLVQPVVDNIMRHEYSVVGLTAMRDHDEYTYAHCVNVSVLSIGMGQALGQSRQVLADLGVAALLHDIGKIAVPGDVLRKPAKLSNDEWNMVKRHPIEGVKMICRMPGLTPLTLDALRVCLEHHMNFDRSGYPQIDLDWGQATLSRVVAVADCFDAITAHRAYHRRPRTPFEALQYMLGPSRVTFDPAVLWALVKTVGLYPAGSVMQTDTGHLVLSLSPNPEDVRRPMCRVLVNPDGSSAPEENAELWSPMPEDRHVVRVLKPEEHSFATSEYLAA
ncbi:MAG TPA: HD domain-containing phosphohydrolase [Candidatus Eisenbacteria bacterium]|nr:HD domain-containing phosphohydrolase [Candidatus Eisenbacteria bacterium]